MNAVVDITRTPSQKCTQQDARHAHDFAARPSGCRWFVVASKPNAERRAHASLHLKGYPAYLPLVTIRRRDRSWHTAPLFPGYLFVQLDTAKPWYPIRYAPGVFNLLSIDGIPSPCPPGAVEALRAAEAERATQPPDNAFWAPGTPCSLATGPFSGHPAVVLAVDDEIARVSLLMFGELRQVSVGVDCLKARDE